MFDLIAQVINPQSIPACVAPAPCPVGVEPQVFTREYITLSEHQTLSELRSAIARIRAEGCEQVVITEASNPKRIVGFCDPHDLLIKLISLPVVEYRISEF
jgi:hypothetical protein